jgi:ATP-dependent DNA helicase RecG
MSRLIDTRLDFLSPASVVPGLGAKRVEALRLSGIETLGDLLYHFPKRYIDRSTITPMAELGRRDGSAVNVIGVITRTRVERGRTPRLRIQVADDSGTMEALWFHGIPFFRKTLQTGMRLLLTGSVSCTPACQMIHPQIERIGENKVGPDIVYLPLYPVTSAMKDAFVQQKLLQKSIAWALDNIKHYPQLLPKKIEEKYGFPPLCRCLKELHMPADPSRLDEFRKRLVYEELYELTLTLVWSRRAFALPGRSMDPGRLGETLASVLPFSLTEEQKEAVRVLHADAKRPQRMHRLLQGDTGSGKTVVAFFGCLPALASGLQAAWLVPTELLAQQAFVTLSAWCETLSLRCALLLGQTPASERRQIHRDLLAGEIRLCVGTHSLLSPSVKFRRLGMMVIDEQHKFGAQQRLRLQEKDPAADVLVMSATPIPQTLAKTLYGDLDVVSIRSCPAGRREVSTHLVPEDRRSDMERFILDRIEGKDGRVFWVVPRIDRDEDDDGTKDVSTVIETLRAGPLSSVSMAKVHGRSNPGERLEAIRAFEKGDCRLLVTTTIIEVGIDIAAADILVVENAERFGLSQLHQLRGRVGRSQKQSYCFLLARLESGSMAEKRLSYFCGHHDGFELAEMDLSLRGPGEVSGFRQSGWETLRIADVVRDAALFSQVRQDVDAVLSQKKDC